MNKILLLDIDQTLAGGLVSAHLTTYNQKLHFGMNQSQIADAEKHYAKTFDVPQIKQYREQNPQAEQKFQMVRNQIRTSKQVHLDFTPLPNAANGIKLFIENEFKFGGYYSVRPVEVFSTTKKWLRLHKFPSPENVTICHDPQNKLENILQDWQDFRGIIFLIDDDAEKLFNLMYAHSKFKPLVSKLVLINGN